MSPLGRRRHEKVEAWRAEAKGELARLRSLTPGERAAEVMAAGFTDQEMGAPRTQIGLANTLCPDAPPVVGGDDVDLVRQFGGLVAEALATLEAAGLLLSRVEGRSALRFYRLTETGAAAMAGNRVAAAITAP